MSKIRMAVDGLRNAAHIGNLTKRVELLEAGLEESRRLNERLSDVLDVVVELLVPAVDRDEERLREALKKI
ncbi:MAG TPA: hypothetical protein PKK40_11655 [Marmoricola sp.]|nr:hypothetical protein [Marmoricola sp.]